MKAAALRLMMLICIRLTTANVCSWLPSFGFDPVAAVVNGIRGALLWPRRRMGPAGPTRLADGGELAESIKVCWLLRNRQCQFSAGPWKQENAEKMRTNHRDTRLGNHRCKHSQERRSLNSIFQRPSQSEWSAKELNDIRIQFQCYPGEKKTQ